MNDKLKEFAKLLSEELKKTKVETQKILQEDTPVQIIAEKENTADLVASYLSKKVELKEQDNIEQNRWNDPLKQADKKFVTFKDMNDHYGLFLQRIQQQMSSMGGGGEVKFARLDDINSSTVGTNKYLTYNQATKKFYFNTIGTGEGIYLNGDNEVTLNVASPTVLGGIKIGPGFTTSANGEISLNAGPMFEMDESDVFQLKVATETQFGGVKLGPGVTTNGNGQIIIDSTGLDFSFGDFGASVGKYSSNTDYAILQAINDDEDIVIASNGTGGVNIVGQFHVHPTNGSLTALLEEEPIFAIKADGQVKILVPLVDSTAGAVSIIGSSTGEFISPVNTGVMLHVTGNLASPGIPSRIYNDSQNAFAAFVARRFNGSVDAPTAVLANEEIMRISGTAHNGTTIPGTGNQRIVYKALGNQTLSNQGGDIEFWATPLNTTTITKVATVGSTGITLESGKVLSGNVTGNVTGNADTVTNGVYTSGDQTIGGTKTFSSTISGSINGTANIATTVALVATNSTAATHYLTFVDSATGNENVRTDTDLTYNPSTSTLSVTKISGHYIRSFREAGVIADGGTVTIDFSTDSVVHISWDNSFTLAYQNYTAGTIVKLLANKRAGTGTDTFSLDGITAGQVSGGSTTVSSVAGQTTFVEFICTGTDIGSVYAKL